MRAAVAGSCARSAARVTQQRGARIGEHEGEALGRVVGVERQIGAAGLEDAEERDQHVERALQAEPDHDLGAHPVRAQMMRELARARIEFAIAQPRMLAHHRGGLRARRPPGRQTAPAGWARDRARGVVPRAQDAMALIRRQDVQPPDRRIGIANRRLQQPDEPPRQRLHAGLIKQVGAIAKPQLQPLSGVTARLSG